MDLHRGRRGRHNRVWLAITGLLAIVAGGLALARGLGVLGAARAGEPLLSGDVPEPAAIAREPGWFWYVVAGAAVAIALLGLSWLAAQRRTHALRRVSVEPEPGYGATRMPARVASGVLAGELACYPGVTRVKARLTGSSEEPCLAVTVRYDERADIAVLRAGAAQSVDRLRAALDAQVPAVVRLRVSDRRLAERDLYWAADARGRGAYG